MGSEHNEDTDEDIGSRNLPKFLRPQGYKSGIINLLRRIKINNYWLKFKKPLYSQFTFFD